MQNMNIIHKDIVRWAATTLIADSRHSSPICMKDLSLSGSMYAMADLEVVCIHGAEFKTRTPA